MPGGSGWRGRRPRPAQKSACSAQSVDPAFEVGVPRFARQSTVMRCSGSQLLVSSLGRVSKSTTLSSVRAVPGQVFTDNNGGRWAFEHNVTLTLDHLESNLSEQQHIGEATPGECDLYCRCTATAAMRQAKSAALAHYPRV